MTRNSKTSQQDPYQNLLCLGWEEPSPHRPAVPPTAHPQHTHLSLHHSFSPFTTQKTQDSQARPSVENGKLPLPPASQGWPCLAPLSAVPTPSHLLLPQA